MLIFDTNIISETMRPAPNPDIVQWINDQPSDSVWTTSITVFEILTGIEKLPDGKRKRRLRAMFEICLVEDFHGRVIEFDINAASAAAALAAQLHRAGQTVDMRDLQIAGIAVAKKAILVTRNVKDFQQMNLPLINPWDSPSK